MKTLTLCHRQNYPTKRDKQEFVYMYRAGFAQLLNGKDWSGWNEFAKLKIVKWLGNRARAFFSYSPNYPNADITWNFLTVYRKMERSEG